MRAEVAGGVDEGGSGEVHPDAVGPNARGEWIAVVSQAAGEFEAAGALGEVFVFFAEEGEEGARDVFAFGARITTFVDAGVIGFSFFPKDHGAGESVG